MARLLVTFRKAKPLLVQEGEHPSVGSEAPPRSSSHVAVGPRGDPFSVDRSTLGGRNGRIGRNPRLQLRQRTHSHATDSPHHLAKVRVAGSSPVVRSPSSAPTVVTPSPTRTPGAAGTRAGAYGEVTHNGSERVSSSDRE